ncbi:MAG: CD225/dispanin family protein [Thermoguttaceae bacterium]|nr:CD225/dispanin family protein [Thermoguttaceae bacterium]
MNWFYYDQQGQKIGPISDLELRELIDKGLILPDTKLETDTGHSGKARQVPGLFAAAGQNASAGAQAYCTHCGSPVARQAAVCLSCGCRPDTSNKFCRACGAVMSPEQVLCVRCGTPVQTGPIGGDAGGGEDIPDYMGWAIAEMLLCNFVFGILAMVYASGANTAKERGDYLTARKKAVVAGRWLWAGVWLAVISVVLGVGLLVIAAIASGEL